MYKGIQFTEAEILQWRDWYKDDAISLRDIAARVGCRGNTIRARLAKIGVEFDAGKKISGKMKGRPGVRKGAKHSEATKIKMGIAQRGNKNCCGRVCSDETRAKMRATWKRRLAEGLPERGWRAPAERLAASAITEAKRQKYKRVFKSLFRATKIRKQKKTSDALGYTRGELVAHIERQFSPEMSWADRKSFSIDHIIPIAEFIRRGVTDPKIICSLKNLRPMVPIDNRKKSDKYDGDFEVDMAALTSAAAPYEKGLVA